MTGLELLLILDPNFSMFFINKEVVTEIKALSEDVVWIQISYATH